MIYLDMVVFAFLGTIWNSNNWLNFIIKFVLVLLAIWHGVEAFNGR